MRADMSEKPRWKQSNDVRKRYINDTSESSFSPHASSSSSYPSGSTNKAGKQTRRRQDRDACETDESGLSDSASPAAARTGLPAWKRVLYMRQPYPDNHVDETFLSCLVANARLLHRQKTYSQLVVAAEPIVRQLSLVAIWVAVFCSLPHRPFHPFFPSSHRAPFCPLSGIDVPQAGASADLPSLSSSSSSSSLLSSWPMNLASLVLVRVCCAASAARKGRSYLSTKELVVVEVVAAVLGLALVMALAGCARTGSPRASFSAIARSFLRRATRMLAFAGYDGVTAALFAYAYMHINNSIHHYALAALVTILSPILLTLTERFSDDTVAALAASSLFLHLLVADYRTPAPPHLHLPLHTPLPSTGASAAALDGRHGADRSTIVYEDVFPASEENDVISPPISSSAPASASATASFTRQRSDMKTRTKARGLRGSSVEQDQEGDSRRNSSDPICLPPLPHSSTGCSSSFSSSSSSSPDEADAIVSTSIPTSGRAAVSFNAIVFASVTLLSRILYERYLIAFLLVTFYLFTGTPIVFRLLLAAQQARAARVLTWIMALVAWFALACNAPAAGTVFAGLVFLVSFIAPFLFLQLQSTKLELEGPWDYDDSGETGKENI